MKKISVVFVSSVFEEAREGPAIYARYLWHHFFDHEEIDFHLVVPKSSVKHPNIHEAGEYAGSIKLYSMLQSKALQVARDLDNAIIHGNSAHTMWRCLKYSGPLVVQVNDYDAASVYSDTLAYFRKKMFRRYLSFVWRNWNERRAVKAATFAICNSRFTKDHLLRSYDSDPDKLKVIYKAVDTSDFRKNDSCKRDPFPDRALGSRLIFVGTNWRRKGLDTLLAALAEVVKTRPDVTLEVAGPKREDLGSDILEFIKNAVLEDKVIFAGVVERDELPTHFSYADLFVMPSNAEALGVSILEALASGVPVIASKIGGIPEILEGRDCGVMVNPNDVVQLKNAILDQLGNPGRLEVQAENGLTRAKEFDSEIMLAKLETLYRSLAKKKSG